MQPFIQHSGIAAPLLRANIDTDQLIPKQFLSKVSRDGFGIHLFHDWRYLDDAGEQPNPDFILNQAPYQDATILLAGENFGCGSSREHAPWALADFGFRVIFAASFADIFFQNAINNGLLPVVLPMTTLTQLAQSTLPIRVDLRLQQLQQGHRLVSFEIEPSIRQNLLLGLDPIGETLVLQDAIDAFEQQQPCWR
ncbi:MAG: 3-isopropylmalate dehydratase small subunit [Ferrimonas sp.]